MDFLMTLAKFRRQQARRIGYMHCTFPETVTCIVGEILSIPAL